MSDLLISSSLDQEAVSSGDWALELIDTKIQEAIETQNVDILFETIRNLRELAKVTGLALAKILYMMHRNWDVFSDKNDFGDEVFIGTGLHPHTTERYVKVWSMFAQRHIPEHLESEFRQKNIKDLIPIANALHQGYDIDEENWEELAYAPDYATVAKVVRDDIKNVEPRKNTLQLYLKRDGTVVAYKGQQQENVAWLDLESENELVQQAVERIKRNSGMLEQ